MRALINADDHRFRIPPTTGASTRDQEWSALDAIKLFLIRWTPACTTPEGRRQMFDLLSTGTAEAAIVAAGNGKRRWIVGIVLGAQRNVGIYSVSVTNRPPSGLGDGFWLSLHLHVADWCHYAKTGEPRP